MDEEFLTKEELANCLKVTQRTIDNLRKKGLPNFTVGNNVRFNKEKVFDWLGANSNNGKTKNNYSEHSPGHIRKSLIEAFEISENNDIEWWQAFETKEQVLNCLSGLWHCNDSVSLDIKEAATVWLEENGFEDKVKLCQIGYDCTFAQLVRALKPIFLEVTNKD